MKSVWDRFWAKVDKAGPLPTTRPELGPCWLWTASKNNRGYGTFTVVGRTIGAHRISYEYLVGAIPPKLQLDHLCLIKYCVNPKHLELVTCGENLRRGGQGLRGNKAAARRQRSKTHCPKGHPYFGDNLMFRKTGARICKTCRDYHNSTYRKLFKKIEAK